MLKSGVRRGGENPPGGLKLMDLAETLNPRMVDKLLLRDLASGYPPPRDEWYVPMNGVMAKALLVVIGAHGHNLPDG